MRVGDPRTNRARRPEPPAAAIAAGGLVIVARAAGVPARGLGLEGWALAAVLWVASRRFGLLLTRLQAVGRITSPPQACWLSG